MRAILAIHAGLVGVCCATLAGAAGVAWAQPAARQWHRPIQQEGATVRISERVYVVPDFKVGMVPNVGIVVGGRATLVVDPGMDKRNGEIVLREVRKVAQGTEIDVVNTHCHPEHTRGDTVTVVDGDGVLFSDDPAKGHFPAFATPQSRSDTWLASPDEMARLKPGILVPAHYEVTDASTIEAYRGYPGALRARVAALKREGESADETAEIARTESAAKHPDWHQPLRVHTAATALYRELQ